MRIKIFHIVIAFLFCVLVFGLMFLQLIRGNAYYRLANNNRIRLIPQKAQRGFIFDRNGVIIADNRISFDVAVVPQDVRDFDAVVNYLSVSLNREKSDLLREYRLNRWAPFAPVIVARNISRDTAIKLEEDKNRYPGVSIQVNAKRFYPLGPACSHILGYIGQIDRSRITRLKDYGYKIKDMIGYSGVEEYYDNFLRGEDGGIQVEVNNLGNQIRMLGMRQPRKGRDLVLTVDSRMQKIAFSALKGRRGAAVFMDPDNGEILCMVSSPAFDPNVFIDRDNDGLLRRYFRDSSSPLLNRAIQGLYSPGSVFKIVTALSALDTGKSTFFTSFFCKGSFFLGRQEFACSHPHGMQDLRQAIAHSCNVYFYHLGLMAGPDILNKYARELSLGYPTHIDLPSEAKGLVPSRMQKKFYKNENWYKGDTVNFSIGQGDLLVTSLQLVKMMAVVIERNTAIRPHIVTRVGGKERKYRAAQSRLRIAEKYTTELKSDLRAVVSEPDGTAAILNIKNLKVAGKTGTAQVARGKSHAWFVGFFPSDQPRLVFCVFLENGGSSYNACVAAKEMLEAMLTEKVL